ncbi:MAG: hypothetical protein K2W82_15710 [Candidatus Obscuribacterales bacterium]|jgi:hypothetical protein|nr:hypothetical protein [Candidatus Obscuribacterales bacterium]
MTSCTASALKGAQIIDFSGSNKSFRQMDKFGPEFIDLVRGDQSVKAVVVIDRCFGGTEKQPVIVTDHLNVSGSNPLVGPNHELGERFPIVQGIYVTDCLSGFAKGIAAGVKQGLKLSADDAAFVKSLGADFYCHNLVPAMLIAAHAHWKVLGIVLPEGVELNDEQIQQITALTRN